MTDTGLTTRSSAYCATSLLTRQLVPAALGICAALLLGGSGFGLGYLYAWMSAPVTAPAVLASSGLAMDVEPIGGPEEPASLPAVVATAQPVVASNSGQGLAMSRPVVGGWVSSRFGQRQDPFTGMPAVHRGLDFAGLNNSVILAVAPGVVTWSGRQRGYGNFIEIDHGQGWVTRYGHNAFNLVTPGDYVKPGQTIALMGATGRATGTHLHFEVLYRGRHQNPARFVPRDI
ncbi:MAG: M23 family metallopeptidase [Gammaproteobacteria bacterium]|nr:M23 family metallopeptidase [Gammaproteobacteria bacterium]